jgi:hypothetical protein
MHSLEFIRSLLRSAIGKQAARTKTLIQVGALHMRKDSIGDVSYSFLISIIAIRLCLGSYNLEYNATQSISYGRIEYAAFALFQLGFAMGFVAVLTWLCIRMRMLLIDQESREPKDSYLQHSSRWNGCATHNKISNYVDQFKNQINILFDESKPQSRKSNHLCGDCFKYTFYMQMILIVVCMLFASVFFHGCGATYSLHHLWNTRISQWH